MKSVVITFTALLSAQVSFADSCKILPNWNQLKAALKQARDADNGGLNLDMWATMVDRDGIVCAVAFSGHARDDQWPGSRVISAQKANTANAFSLKKLSLSTANLFAPTQPGNSLFGLQESNPVNISAAYTGDSRQYGTRADGLVGKKIGGVNVFGGGLALYTSKGAIVGALGVSGDTSCADHNIAWRTRNILKLDFVPGGVSPAGDDNIIYASSKEITGFAHPVCGNKENTIQLPTVSKP